MTTMTIRSPRFKFPYESDIERRAAAMVIELRGDGTYEVIKSRYDMQGPVEATICIDPESIEVEDAQS